MVPSETEVLRVIVESIDYGIWKCDPQGQTTYVSEAFRELLGMSLDQCLGDGWMKALEPLRRSLIQAAWQECVEKGLPWRADLRLRGADGRWHIVLARGNATRNEAGKVTGWAGIYQDITEMRDAQHQLEDANDALLRTNTELDQFAYMASHDLQEPLRVIRLMARLLASRYNPEKNQDAATYLKTIEDSASRMTGLVRDLLDYAQVLHLGRAPKNLADLNQALEIGVQDCALLIEESGAVVCRGPMPTLTANMEQIARVFQNLISNAIKYRREERPSVKVYADERGAEWRFTVEDNGRGMPAQDLQLVFEPFKRLESGDIPGSGLGLAVCKKIVEQHGGRIWVDSEPGLGSMFMFTLPME